MVSKPGFRELKLMASPGAWRLYSGRKADSRFKAFEQKVFQRDKYTCQFCGFQARLFQDIVNLDGDYSNNRPVNLATACCFCAQCFFLESVGVGGYGGGTLVYLPELSQAEVNSLCYFARLRMIPGTKIAPKPFIEVSSFEHRLLRKSLVREQAIPPFLGIY